MFHSLDGPIFEKKLEIVGMEKVVEDKYCGHVELKVEIKPKIFLKSKV